MPLKKLIRSEKQIEKNYLTYLILMSLMVFIGIMSSPQIALAQADMTLTGTVTDSSGAVVPQATVELFSAATKDTRRQITGQDGRYSFPTVVRGKYRLTVSMAGFRKKVISDISVDTPKSYTVDVSVEVAGLSETVVVTGTRSEQEIGKISSAVSVVSQEDIQTGKRNSTLEESLKQTRNPTNL